MQTTRILGTYSCHNPLTGTVTCRDVICIEHTCMVSAVFIDDGLGTKHEL